MARPCTCEDDGKGARAGGYEDEVDNVRGHNLKAARDRKCNHETASVRVGHAKTVRAYEGDIEVSGHVMTIPPTYAEPMERPHPPTNALLRPSVYAKDQGAIDCTEGCASTNKCGEEGSYACE